MPGSRIPRPRAERQAADERLATWIEQQPIEAVVAHWEAQPIFATQRPELVAAQRRGRLSHDPGRLAQLLRDCGQGVLEPLWGELARLALPVLAIAGERDQRYSTAARRIASATSHGRCELVAGAGHAPQLEQPAAVAALLENFVLD